MVPERDRKEVYDDVLFFLAKKEKVTVTGLDSSAPVSDFVFFASLQTLAIHFPDAPGPQLLTWKLVWHLHICISALGLQPWAWEGRKESLRGWSVTRAPSPCWGRESLAPNPPGFPSCLPFPKSSAQVHLGTMGLPCLTPILWLPRNRPSSSGAATSRP